MATTVTSDNFDEYFIEAMNTYGSAIENDTDVPVIDAANIDDTYSLPVVKNTSGVLNYGKVPIGGENGLINEIAEQVASTGVLETISEEEFEQIFD